MPKTMNVIQKSSRLIKPIYKGDPPSNTLCVPLTVFDRFTYKDSYDTLIYAYKPPNPSNALLLQGLQHALSEYRELAGRFVTNEKGHRVILLNDEGIRFIEASADCTLSQVLPFTPSTLLSLDPSSQAVKEFTLVKFTRFSCGSLVIGFSSNHMVADGHSVSQFMVSWGQACRGLDIKPCPFHDRTIFVPRDPPRFEFEHRGVEFTNKLDDESSHNSINNPISSNNNVVMHLVHFTSEFIQQVKRKASLFACCGVETRTYTTFESLLAHLWRALTRARKLNESETTNIRISVNGRARLNPRVPKEYFGNVVLWAFPTTQVKDLLHEPLCYAAKLIDEAVEKVNDEYFKSYIDFAANKVDEEGLFAEAHKIKKSFSPNLQVDSWLRFEFSGLDFGAGKPYIFMPSYYPMEGLIYLIPSFSTGDGSIDAYVYLFGKHLASFKEIIFSLE